jgi:hypothetical protein
MILPILLITLLGAEDPDDLTLVTYDHLPDDLGTYTPWANTPTTVEKDPFTVAAVADFRRALTTWPPAQDHDPRHAVESCLALAALLDAARAPTECDAPPILFEHLTTRMARPDLIAALTHVALHPTAITPRTQDATFHVTWDDQQDLRERMGIYARKMLGRVMGRLPVVRPARR